jgi:hypothetical protein
MGRVTTVHMWVAVCVCERSYVCVRWVHACACVRACVCVCECVRVRARVHERVCTHTHARAAPASWRANQTNPTRPMPAQLTAGAAAVAGP